MNWMLFWYSQTVHSQCSSCCLKKDVTNRGLEMCNEKASRQRWRKGGERGSSVFAMQCPQQDGNTSPSWKEHRGRWKRPMFVLDGATCDPKTWTLLSKCSVLGMPSVWPGKLQPRIGITVILPAHSAKFSQKHAGKAALLESLPLPFICRLSMRALRRGMETSGPSSPSSAQGCQMESCPFRGEHSNRRAARLSWNVSCASLYNVAALSSSKESKQRNFSSVTSVPPFRHLAGSRRGDLWAYTSLPFLSLPAWKEGT